jgi:hypothetical protein
MKWYYYLHSETKDLISKNPVVVDSDPDYFDSPFVQKVWLLDMENRADAWTFIIEASALGAKTARIKDLAARWGLTLQDLPEFLARAPKPTQS